MKSAINAQTATVYYLADRMNEPAAVSFEDSLNIAHEAMVPVIVDAASEAPPISTLSRFTKPGADLVIFSGGKSIRGPQSTGLVVGRTDLIAAIVANGVPFATIGRQKKVSREEIIAFIRALELFLHRDHDADLAVWDNQLKHIEDSLASTAGITLQRFTKGETYHVPLLAIESAEGAEVSIEEIHDALLACAPRIAVATHLKPGILVINPHSLQPGEERIVAERLKTVIEAIT